MKSSLGCRSSSSRAKAPSQPYSASTSAGSTPVPHPNWISEPSCKGASLLLSDDLWGFHFDLNGLAMEQQDDTTRIRRPQFAETLSVSHPIAKVTVSGEIWHFAQPLTQSSATGNLWCASYSLRPNLVIDAGFDRGFSSTSTHWETFAGFTYVLPHRLWRKRNQVF